MAMERWHPKRKTTRQEEFLLKRLHLSSVKPGWGPELIDEHGQLNEGDAGEGRGERAGDRPARTGHGTRVSKRSPPTRLARRCAERALSWRARRDT